MAMPQAHGEQLDVQRDYLADWLGIPPDQRPASFYALCGVGDMTEDVEKIAASAKEHIKKLRPFAGHPVHGAAASKLLETVTKAMGALTDAESKKQYDLRLRSRKLHAITVLGKKLLEGDRERLAEFIDGSYAVGGNFPVREIEAAIVETYHRYRGQRFSFSRLAGYLRSPAWHTEAHLLVRLDESVHERQKNGEKFRDKRHTIMGEGLKMGLSPAQALAVWANRVQYELTLENTLRTWGLGPDGQPLETKRAWALGIWPWITMINSALVATFFLIALTIASGRRPATSASQGSSNIETPAERTPVRTWIHAPRVLRGQHFGSLAVRFESESVEARKAAYLRMLYLAAAGDEEIIAVVNGLIARELDPSIRACVLLTLARRQEQPQANRLSRALLPLASNTRIGRIAASWMYEHAFGSPPPANRSPSWIREELFYKLYQPPSPPNVVTISRAGFEQFTRNVLAGEGDQLADAEKVRELAGSPPSAGRIVEMAAIADGLLRSPLTASVSVKPTDRLDVFLYRLGAVGRQWLLDELKAAPAYKVRPKISAVFKLWFIDDSRLDPHAYRAIAAMQYVQMFDQQSVRRVIQLLRHVVSKLSPGSRRLFDSAVEYLAAASGIKKSFDFDAPLSRSTAQVTFSRWFERKYDTAP